MIFIISTNLQASLSDFDAHEVYVETYKNKFWIPKGLRWFMGGLVKFYEQFYCLFVDKVIVVYDKIGMRYGKKASTIQIFHPQGIILFPAVRRRIGNFTEFVSYDLVLLR